MKKNAKNEVLVSVSMPGLAVVDFKDEQIMDEHRLLERMAENGERMSLDQEEKIVGSRLTTLVLQHSPDGLLVERILYRLNHRTFRYRKVAQVTETIKPRQDGSFPIEWGKRCSAFDTASIASLIDSMNAAFPILATPRSAK
jgi:hypothetical protein